MKASIIAAGSEMLGPSRVDTNSLKLTSALEEYGVELVRKSIVGDDLRALSDEIRFAVEHSDLLITSGGLGPTEDDLMRWDWRSSATTRSWRGSKRGSRRAAWRCPR